jgi:Ca2+-binding RTX toxin-like protein
MAIFNGTGASETIKGSQDADTISGLGGNDRLFGLSGADVIFGNDGNDIIAGGGGKDTLTGGAGADRFTYFGLSDSRGANVDLITDFSVSDGDVLDLSLISTPATLQPAYNPSLTDAQAVFQFNSTTNITTLSIYQGSSTPVFQVKFTGHVEYDQSAFPTISEPFDLFPTEGNDQIIGTPNADTIDLLGGDDFYAGRDGDDTVAGGSGNDFIGGEGGNDNIRGGSGDDAINGGTGVDILYGGTGNDTLVSGETSYGGDGNDRISGDAFNDSIWGQAGDDAMAGYQGNDTLNGGDGYDTVFVNGDPSGAFANFSIAKVSGKIILTDLNGASDGIDWGTDTLIHVEAIQFTDGIYVVATNTFTPFDSVV